MYNKKRFHFKALLGRKIAQERRHRRAYKNAATGKGGRANVTQLVQVAREA
jgi:hypothetical protein